MPNMSTYSSACSSRKSSSQDGQDAEFFEIYETINKCGLDMEQVDNQLIFGIYIKPDGVMYSK